MSQVAKILQDLGIRLAPGFIVGCKYSFGTVWNGQSIFVEGLVTDFLWKVDDVIYYGASAPTVQVVQVIGLVKEGDQWRLHVLVNQAVIVLSGNFTLI